MSHTLTVSSAAVPVFLGAPALEPVRLSGREGLNRLFEYELLLQTPDTLNLGASAAADFNLDDFIGREISCTIALDGSGRFIPGVVGASVDHIGAGTREINALIADAACLGEQGRHIRYRLTLRPWLHLATLSTDCKIFQNKTVVEILDELLADYPFAVDRRLVETYPPRDYQTQFNESDFAFFERLCQEWGINYFFAHAEGKHRLVLIDNMGAFQENPSEAYRQVAYHTPGWKPDAEYLHAFVPEHHLTSGRYATRDYDYTRPRADLSQGRQDPRPTGQADGEVYQWHDGGAGGAGGAGSAGSHYAQPRAGSAEANDPHDEGRLIALLRMQALRTHGARAQASGNLRGMTPGFTFGLRKHPRQTANADYLILDTRFLIENVGQDSQRPGPGNAPGLRQQWRVEVDLTAHPVTEPLRPEPTRAKPHTHGPQTALVVGPEGQNLWTDELGRIKVQFPWDRIGARNQHSTCWLRVSSPWAGNQLGGIHIPRIGQEVIVDFLGGDADLPICTGRVHNQVNLPPWSLPSQSALSGFRSRELTKEGGNSAAGRSNHLVLDDTEAKIQAQLKSDHQHSQLSLGHITRIEDNAGRKDARGEGFELRTDGHGVVRAKDGLLISTEGRTHARGHVTDMGETVQRLTAARDRHEDLSEAALQARAHLDGDQDEVTQALKAQNDAIEGGGTGTGESEGHFPELGEPHLVLASPAGIESTTAGSTHIASDAHTAFTSGGHISVSAGRSLLASVKEAIRMFAVRTGVMLKAGRGDIDVTALKHSVNLLAKMNISVQGQKIAITAKDEVVINGGTSYTRWSSEGIEHGTQGYWVEHAASHGSPGPDNVPVPQLPVADVKDSPNMLLLRLGSHTQNGYVFAGEPYELFRNGASIGHGITDEHGQILVKDHQGGTASYEVRLTNGARFDLRVHDRLTDSAEHRLANKGFRANKGSRSRHQDYGIDERGNDA
ncbi:type VI secretion system tip protein TssI/VgrG [Variovorax sp. J22P168]|uniref:type VI secretion system Vgr family protein n=1 Tax=Variovorax jilinensis TaxID=3053513 RepID=UPI002575D123|nr:type VI secretion system Vgr family protein [Variovorax sp. J22P168]MDM0011040.1 type VI secretion system tip protein TssI/VgrG [Variovorax sp. J22P168]